MATPAAELHPADLVHERRVSRVLARLHAAPAYEARCDHGRLAGECGNCLGLRHAEEKSVAVRAAYAFGEWPPTPCACPCGCGRSQPDGTFEQCGKCSQGRHWSPPPVPVTLGTGKL